MMLKAAHSSLCRRNEINTHGKKTMKVKSRFQTRLGILAACSLMLLASWMVTTHAQRPSQQTTKPKPGAAVNAQSAQKYALLIGINRYLSAKVSPLDGSEHDADLMFDLLTQDYGFDKNNVTLLKGPNATAANIRKNFQWLVEQAKKSKDAGNEAVIVLHYSGHGSQVDDPYHEKPDGKSETIVPYDSREGNVFDIVDHEINDFVIDLTQYTSNVTLIFDSCHSGTVSRGDEPLKARLAPDDKRQQPKYERRHARESIAAKSVTLSAALSYQRAYERDPSRLKRGEKPDGLMTYYLVQGLKRAARSTTYRQLMQEVSMGVKDELRSGQDPQAEGNVDAPIFGGAALRAEPYITIADVNAQAGTVTFNAGAVHGVKEGAKIAIYAANATAYRGPEGFLTDASVTEVTPNSATAEMPKGNPNAKKVDKLSKVVLLSPVFGGGPIRVDLGGAKSILDKESGKPLAEQVTSIIGDYGLEKDELVKFVSAGATAANDNGSPLIRLRVDEFKYVFPSAAYLVPPKNVCNLPKLPADKDKVLYLDDGSGRALFSFFELPGEADAQRIARAIDLYARQRNLLAIANASSTLADGIKVSVKHIPGVFSKTCLNGTEKRSFAADKTAQADSVNGPLDQGQVFEVSLKNTSKQIAYVTVILVGTEGSIDIVFPEGGNAASALLPVGAETALPKRVTTPPAGVEKYIVFVTREPTDFSFLQVSGVSRGGVGEPSMLERLLRQSGRLSRSASIGDTPDQWGVFTVDLSVTDKPAALALATKN